MCIIYTKWTIYYGTIIQNGMVICYYMSDITLYILFHYDKHIIKIIVYHNYIYIYIYISIS